MKKIQLYLLVAFSICFVTESFSQRGQYDIVNGIGLFGGITKVNLTTDNFITKEGDGFIGGLSATVDIPFKWYNMSYGLHFSESTVSVLGRPLEFSPNNEYVDYKLFAAQLALMMHVKLVGSYITLDVGPMLQYNSRLEFEDATQEGYFINNYDNLLAEDISNISQFNIDGAVGITAGFKFVKLRAHYIYGATNILKKLESEDIDTSGGDSRFKGNMSMLLFGAMLSF
ncbi:hypothetical protein FPF71_00935 [Algibacter amylolyticus]|uniref:PorT family protein n=1 Tax=Algibacter amylolyticus TaxID=1608400 RepID=A0A5M7BIY9_9FLAO|nr:hypothetical protein [Algibacter amylolyticus]KAA5827441.1 hypothetical protein F2B50_00935 [Algibacter amylolyticus]MBB5266635.1 hypothetical protein [Algibacter amylolyticus]TSJ81686.1 hypothetical protein FPF71_00935 [Algibacter amylolyticus]